MSDEEKTLRGDLANFSIFDLCQSMMVGRKSGLMTLQHDGQKGYVSFEDGQITSALNDDLLTGESAAYHIFSWKTGLFLMEFDAAPRERNITMDTENLLLEVARQIDEHARENVGEEQQTAAIQESLQDKFRTELNKVFDRVATDAKPSRDRYSIHAFDSLLTALGDLGGTALFLRPDLKPRVKTAAGFKTIRDEAIYPGEIDGFLTQLLSSEEHEGFERRREIAVHYTSERGEHFRVNAVKDGGRALCIFSPASRAIPPLSEFGPECEALRDELKRPTGLIVVSGPLASGKSTVLASLIDEALVGGDAFCSVFSRSQTFDFPEDRGFLMRSPLERFALGGEGGITSAIEQGTDIIAIDEIVGSAPWRDSLAVASRAALVIALCESEGRIELARRIDEFHRAEGGEKLHRQLSQSLVAVVDVDLGAEETRFDVWKPDSEIRRRIASGDMKSMTQESQVAR